jgi:hypothetical protein
VPLTLFLLNNLLVGSLSGSASKWAGGVGPQQQAGLLEPMVDLAADTHVWSHVWLPAGRRLPWTFCLQFDSRLRGFSVL